MYSTRLHVHVCSLCTCAHPQRTSSRAKTRVGQKSVDFVGELNGPRAGARNVRKSGRVGVRVRVGPVEFRLKASHT